MAILAAAGLCFLAWRGIRLDWRTPNVDFAAFYSAAKVGSTRYLNASTVGAQNAKLGDIHPARNYVPRPPVFVAIIRPFARLSYSQALLIWRCLLFAAILASVIIWSRWGRSILAGTAWSLPVQWALWSGQDVPISLLAISASLIIPNPLLAGAVLGIAAFKWHLFLFVPVVLIAQRKWRMIAGGFATVAVMVVASFALCPDWVEALVATIANPAMHPHHDTSPGLRFLFLYSPLLFAAIVLLAAAGMFCASRRLPIHAAMAIALAAGCVINAHSYGTDCLLLLPMMAMAIPAPARFLIAWPIPYWALLLSSPVLLWVSTVFAIGCVVADSTAVALRPAVEWLRLLARRGPSREKGGLDATG